MSNEPTYDVIGIGYDEHRRADPEITRRLARCLALKPTGRYLDLACGTGNYTAALAGLGGDWTGVDPSERMLGEARKKSASIAWHHARADALPFAAGAFDGVTCTLAIHHFEVLEAAFAEVKRVLAPDGRFVCFTSTAEQMQGYWLNEYWPRAMQRSIEQMPSVTRLQRALSATGLQIIELDPYEVPPSLCDGFLYRGKHDPAYYFDAEVRHASSTFAMLADPDEVREGCERLAADLQSGRFEEVRQRHLARSTEPPGDYLFLQARAAG